MKYLAAIVLLFQLAKADAQSSCEQWFPYGKGEGFEMEARDADGTAAGRIRFTVLGVSETGGKKVYTVKRELHYDETDRDMASEYTMTCEGDKMYIDTRAFYNPLSPEVMQGMDAEIESENLVMPASLDVGDELPEASMIMTLKQDGMTFSTMSLRLTGKRVVGRETLTVPAGTFDCLKIEGWLNTETKVMDREITSRTRTVEWYSPGTGMVKSESYDKDGKRSGGVALAEKF